MRPLQAVVFLFITALKPMDLQLLPGDPLVSNSSHGSAKETLQGSLPDISTPTISSLTAPPYESNQQGRSTYSSANSHTTSASTSNHISQQGPPADAKSITLSWPPLSSESTSKQEVDTSAGVHQSGRSLAVAAEGDE
ncbi:hypothetical protein WJX75_000554 [Coccomyxa subellipsoidea]|uniref:Uncharacterized protein n=1 Tax=Coccomyxa subellipsoidea TaxID=248742 RepID=A0ABR2YDL7_9CHLO